MRQCSIFARGALPAVFLCACVVQFVEASRGRVPVAAWYEAQRDEETTRMEEPSTSNKEGVHETMAFDAMLVAADTEAHTLEEEAESNLRPRLTPLRFAAIVTTIFLQLSPLRSILEIQRERDVMRYDGYPYFTVLAGATQWCVYGAAAAIGTGDWTHITMDEANGPGIAFGIFYVMVFFRYVPPADPRRAALRNYLIVGAAILIVQAIGCAIFRGRAIWWLGLLGAIGSAQIAVSPYKTLAEVLRTRSTMSWPFDLCFMNFVQSAATGSFGLASNDPWVWIPNAIGVVAGGFQLVLCAAFSPHLVRFRAGVMKDSACVKTLA